MVDHARLLDLAQHLLRRQQRAVDVGRRQHDRELVAAQPGDGVDAAQQPAHARRDTLQHAIAGLMSERVVDLLEPVEIQQQQRERRVRRLATRNACASRSCSSSRFGQIGQRVVIGEIRQAPLETTPLAPRAGLVQLAFDRGGKALEPRLENVVARADAHRGDRGLFAARVRHEDERQVGVAFTQRIGNRAGRKTRHRVVGDDDVPGLALQRTGQRHGIVHTLVREVIPGVGERADHERLVGRRVLD